MDTQLFVGKVHILEWLRPGDRRTGWELFGEIEPMGIMSNPSVDVSFYPVATPNAFVAVVRGIEDEFRQTGRLPLLHIETHGNDDGIGIAEDNGLTFMELMDVLIPLNGATGLRLVVVMAACEGIWAMKMLQPATRSAALAVIGPNRDLEDDELARGLQAFYRGMFTHRGGDRAIGEMNDAIDPARMTFGALHAEQLFKQVYREFFAQRCSEEGLSTRLDAITAEWQAQAVMDYGRQFTPEQMVVARAMLRRHLSDHERHFAAFRRDYFWIDQFPENDQRFPITLGECLEAEA